jgi:hypothetical protein
MLVRNIRNSIRLGIRASPVKIPVRYISKKNERKSSGDRIEFKWFLLVGVFGTMVYMTVMQRIKEQDHSKNLEKYKKTFTEEEWNSYINEIQKKHLTLENGEECYLIPFTNSNSIDSKPIKSTIEKLGGSENVGVLDLNELIKNQLENKLGKSKYSILLNQTLESENDKLPGFKYSFTYRLKPGIFTQIVSDEISNLKSLNPTLGRFIVLNYPPTIKEAIKFEQNVCNKDILITLNDKSQNEDIIQYFETVDKVKSANSLTKLDPIIINTDKKATVPVKETESTVKLHVLSNNEPTDDAPAIEKAQYKLRQLKQPIREYGETDVDVINRLKNLQK